MTSGPRTRTFTQGLLARMVLATIVPATLVLLALVGTNALRKYHLMVDNAKEQLALRAEGLAGWVETMNASGMESAKSLAMAQTAMFGKRQMASDAMRALLEASPQFTGVCSGYEPNADGNDTSMVPENGVGPDGRFLVYWFRDWTKGDAISAKPLTGMEEQEYYVTPERNWRQRKVIERLVTQPYDYEGKVMVSYCWPIIIDGEFKGTVCCDHALADLQAEVEKRAELDDVDIFLVTSEGNVVVASDGTGRQYASDPNGWRMMSVDKTPMTGVFRRFIQSSESGFAEELDDPSAGGMSYFAVARVATGKWTLVMSVPRSTVTGPITADIATTLGFAALGTGLMAALLWVPTRRLVARIDIAASAAQQVAAGDLTRAPIRSDCPDETGDLLRALDSMTDDLNSLVGQVRSAGVQLSTTSTELATTSRRQEEVAASFGASTTQIAAAVRQITATGQELAREMDHVNDVATSTTRLAQDGRVQLESMEGAMQSLDTATAGVADRLAAINEKAVNIGGVVTTITKVAEQTNLLSVNAAIEAEKAGEYGRGFLVVAREIRRLADQTGQATLDIERMVKEMQGAVSSGVMEMDRFSEQVRRNVTDVRTIGRSMNEIIGSVAETSRSFGTVREGMQSQASGAAQISDAMTTLTSNAKATGEAVREFGRAAEDLQRAIGMLKSAIAAFHLRG